jgi:hypothetical protein
VRKEMKKNLRQEGEHSSPIEISKMGGFAVNLWPNLGMSASDWHFESKKESIIKGEYTGHV